MKINGKTVPIKFYDKDANETERPSTIEIPAGLTAQTVLDDYIKAIGGKEAVSNINSTSYFAVYTAPMGELIMDVKRAKGDKWNQTMKMGGNVLSKQVYADGKAVASGMGGSQELSGDDLQMVMEEAMYFPELYAPEKATLAGAEMMGDNQVYVIKWSDDKKTFYDVNTGLMVGQESASKDMQGQKISALMRFSDYKEQSGVKFPMTIGMSMMGRDLAFKVQKVEVNTVKDADFQ